MAKGSPSSTAILLLAILSIHLQWSYSLRPSCGSCHLYTIKHTDLRGHAASKQSQHNLTLTFESSKPKCFSFPKRPCETTPLSDRLLYAVHAVVRKSTPERACSICMYRHSRPDLEPLLPVSKHAPKAVGQEGYGMCTHRGPWSRLDD